jgi:hypothetical protein
VRIAGLLNDVLDNRLAIIAGTREQRRSRGLETLAARLLRRDAQQLHWEIEQETGAAHRASRGRLSIFVPPLLERRKKLEGSIVR